MQTLEGKQYHNINFLNWTANNAEYNSVLQGSNIVFGLSGGEGFDLVTYHATAMGAWPIALNAHAYKDYLNKDNAILIEPSSKFPCYDGMFFHPNQPFNQGNFFDFSEEDFNAACDKAVESVDLHGINEMGLKLQERTFSDAADIILKEVL